MIEGLSDLLQAAREMTSDRRSKRVTTVIRLILSDIRILQKIDCKSFASTILKIEWLKIGDHLRPILAEPLALADLAPHPPPLPLLNAEEPPLFSCPPQPDELDFWAVELVLYFGVLFEFPLHPFPVFL
jgi:hypothetical protein